MSATTAAVVRARPSVSVATVMAKRALVGGVRHASQPLVLGDESGSVLAQRGIGVDEMLCHSAKYLDGPVVPR